MLGKCPILDSWRFLIVSITHTKDRLASKIIRSSYMQSFESDIGFSYRQTLSVLGFLQIVDFERDGNGTNGFVISSLLASVVIVLCHISSPFAVGL